MELIFKEDIILENNRVRLEPLDKTHFNHLLPISEQNPTLLKYSPSPFGNKEQLERYFKRAFTARDVENRYPFAIFDKQFSDYAGSTSYGNVSNTDRRLEIGWTWISPNHQKTGLNTNCKYLLLSYAFDSLSFERVEFRTDSRNLQSINAIEKIGGIYEGKLRNHTLMQDGYRRDTLYYSILKEEWPSLKAKLTDKLL